ncbi:aminotransferase [Tateyamaria omphalii]|uniref:cysteine desulfurase family protein n=1 Tax=Tateyamaria omphalii TaxID=299262 RepID=UPI0016778A7C|nr:cysteine desulfurase family protein [Tateyamaria omphalii]GGX62782.1 aminotransferase [Tateyamaria omphalii]
MSRVYLDHNATTPLRPEAREAMLRAMDVVGNPSSVHAEGRAAKAIVEKARGQVAALMGCDAGDIVFTSGATEAAGMAFPDLSGAIFSDIEHDAVRAAASTGELAPQYVLDVDTDGVLTGTINGVSIFDGMWDDVVAMQAANSETGVLQKTLPIAQDIWATKRGALIVVDAVQMWGKLPYSIANSGADFVLSSAHKFGGPKGIGALYVKTGVEPAVRIKGGGQEMGRRSGTENVIGIAGFGAAAEASQRDVANGKWGRVEKLRNILENALAAASKTTIFVGKEVQRLPNTSCFITPGWKGETQVMQMDLAGFAISAGSACSSGKVKASRVLKATGYSELEAASAVRVSLGLETTEEDVLRFVDIWAQKLKKHEARAA